jgi:hypothetical protein
MLGQEADIQRRVDVSLRPGIVVDPIVKREARATLNLRDHLAEHRMLCWQEGCQVN